MPNDSRNLLESYSDFLRQKGTRQGLPSYEFVPKTEDVSLAGSIVEEHDAWRQRLGIVSLAVGTTILVAVVMSNHGRSKA